MQPSSPRLSSLLRFGLLLLTVGFFAACDRHPAEEVRRDYGHGSSRARNYTNHGIDSKDGKDGRSHFSDTAGTGSEQKTPGEPAAIEKH